MPVDAYPDLSPPMVEIITQWDGHASEEIERLVTLPIEVEMNGVPQLTFMRSISLYGLSDVILTFEDDTDNYFARQVVFERLSQATIPTGVTPTLSPLFSPSGLVYRYVIDSPDRSPQDLKTIEDWVLERGYKSVPGVADDSGFGGTVMQYQVLLDPARLYGFHLTVPGVIQSLSANNGNAGGGFYSQRRPVLLRARDRSVARPQRHREHRAGQPERRARACERRGRGGDRPRAATGRVRLPGPQEGQPRRRRGRHPDAPRRADAERPERGRGENRGAQPAVAARRQDSPLLRSQRSGEADRGYGGRQPAPRHDPGADRADLFPGQRPRRDHHGAHHSAGVAVRFHHPACPQYSRQPALHRRHRLRHHHRRHRGDGGKHLSRVGRPARADLQPV